MYLKQCSKGAASYDLSAAYEYVISSQGKGVAQTGLALNLPFGIYARIVLHLGLVVKNFIDVGVGVFYGDYRGEIVIFLFNHSTGDFTMKNSDRVAQLILK